MREWRKLEERDIERGQRVSKTRGEGGQRGEWRREKMEENESRGMAEKEFIHIPFWGITDH